MNTEEKRKARRAYDNKRNADPILRAQKRAYDARYVKRPEVIARRKKYDNSIERIEARKAALLKRLYNITLEQHKEKFAEQKGLDAITGLPLLKVHSTDHNHDTGIFRGLLNNSINRALGLFQDNPVWLRAAADYIEKRA